MKNKEFYKLLKKNKSNSNSGFTITELLVGVIMSTIVIGALGWGVMQILNITKVQTSKSKIRSEASRAFSFITDELRRAQSIEVDPTAARTTINSNFSSLPTDGTAILALNIPNIPEKVVYYVAQPPTDSVWRGPLAIYRWGPALNADGSYSPTSIDDATDPANWQAQALIDKVDDTPQTATCNGNSVSYTGFYACVIDDDGDGITENATDVNSDGVISSADTGVTDLNGDGEINNEDGADTDNLGITAELFFTGGTDAIGSLDDGNYAASTQAVARARTAPGNNSAVFNSYTMSYKSLGATYGCQPIPDSMWTMRTDFINNPEDPDSEADNSNRKWVHQPDRQPQPIQINTNLPLEISSIPITTGGCISKGGNAAVDGNSYDNTNLGNTTSAYYTDGSGNYTLADGSTPLPDGQNPIFKTDIHRVNHEIRFKGTGYESTFEGLKIIPGKGAVLFLKDGDTIPAYSGYDPDGDPNTGTSQDSLFDFLDNKGYIDSDGKITGIDDNERIVAFEVGHTEQYLSDGTTPNPGFDLQDNIFILTSDVFANQTP